MANGLAGNASLYTASFDEMNTGTGTAEAGAESVDVLEGASELCGSRPPRGWRTGVDGRLE